MILSSALMGYFVGYLIGTFAIMIICTVLAIIFANKGIAWVLYAVGAVLTFFSLLGNGYLTIPIFLIVFAILLVIGCVGIVVRRKISDKKYYQYIAQAGAEQVICPQCGAHVAAKQVFCPHCNHKM